MSETNPYSLHDSESIDEEFVKETLDFSQYYVKRRVRLANNIIDSIVYYGISYLITDVLFSEETAAYDMDTTSFIALFALGPLVLWFAYFALMESTNQVTFGKLLTGTKVVTVDGRKPDTSTILLRTLCRFVPFDGLSFLGNINRGWHDQWSKTIVVRNDFPEVD